TPARALPLASSPARTSGFSPGAIRTRAHQYSANGLPTCLHGEEPSSDTQLGGSDETTLTPVWPIWSHPHPAAEEAKRHPVRPRNPRRPVHTVNGNVVDFGKLQQYCSPGGGHALVQQRLQATRRVE